jgi:hypothetical protein
VALALRTFLTVTRSLRKALAAQVETAAMLPAGFWDFRSRSAAAFVFLATVFLATVFASATSRRRGSGYPIAAFARIPQQGERNVVVAAD